MVGSAHPTEGMAFDFPDRHLERLARLAQRHSQVISLRGTTADDQAVSGFVGALQRSGLFERVELLVENHAQRRDATPRAFTIQLRVSPIPDRLNPPPPATTDPEKSTVAQAIRP